jgi:hypothetical protein
MEHKKPMAIKSSAKIQLHVKLVSQLILHEVKSVKCVFIFNRNKNLNNDNFCKLHVFWELMVECGRCGDFVPKLGQ